MVDLEDPSLEELPEGYGPEAFAAPPLIPVHVLSGFLGTGKTTAIRDLLSRHAETERIAVVVNEFGDLGVDGALLSDCISCILKEVPGGCVCCTAMRDLEASIEEMLALVLPTRLVVEPTGLARASELVDLFRSPRFSSRFELRPVVTMLDPRQDLRAACEREPLFRDQVEVGDVLVLNFGDLATGGELARARDFLAGLRPPKMAVLETSLGVLPGELLAMRLPDHSRVAAPTLLLPALGAEEGVGGEAPGGGEHGHGPTGVEGYVGRGWLNGPERLFDAGLLSALVGDLAAGSLGLRGSVARAKGIFRTTDGWVVHEIAGGRPSKESTPYRRDSRLDVILREPSDGDFAVIGARLEDALVPEHAPLLVVEDPLGFRHAFDRRSLERLAERIGTVGAEDAFGPEEARERGLEGRALRFGPLLEAAGVPAELGWTWLVAERGMFGVGAPRALLSEGLLFFQGDGDDPFRFVLPEGVAKGHEDDVDQCRDVAGLCSVRVVPVPGEDGAGDGDPGGVTPEPEAGGGA